MEENKDDKSPLVKSDQNEDVSAIGEVEDKSVTKDASKGDLLDNDDKTTAAEAHVAGDDHALSHSGQKVIIPINDIKLETTKTDTAEQAIPENTSSAPISINSLDATISTAKAAEYEPNFDNSNTAIAPTPAFQLPVNPTKDKEARPVLNLVAFAVSLALVMAIISDISGLFEICFNHIGTKSGSDSLVSSYLGSYELKAIIWLCTSLVISGAIYIFLVIFINRNSPLQLSKFGRKVYNLLYGAFMAILSLATIASFTNLIYSCFVPLVPKESSSYSYTGDTAWWSGVLQALCTTAVMGFVLFYYYKKLNSRAKQDETR